MKKPDQLRKQAREQHLSGNTKDAIILLTEAISSDPSNVLVALDMVQIFLDIGEIEQAQALFERLPESAQKSDIGLSISSQLNFILINGGITFIFPVLWQCMWTLRLKFNYLLIFIKHYTAQFSTFKPETLSNSFVLLVIIMALILLA
jgi:tetratricopeptide (TPR) repeat protein